jgi:hypothetical protein
MSSYSSLLYVNIKISTYAAPRFNVWIRVSKLSAVGTCSTLLAPLSISTLSTSKRLTSSQLTYTWRVSGHCLGTFMAVNLCLLPITCYVSHYSPTFSSLSFSFKGLRYLLSVFIYNRMLLAHCSISTCISSINNLFISVWDQNRKTHLDTFYFKLEHTISVISHLWQEFKSWYSRFPG